MSTFLVGSACPAYGALLALAQEGNKVRPALGERDVQQARDDLEAGRQLQVRKVLRDGLRCLDRAEVLQAEVLGDDEDLLPVLVRPEDLRAHANDEHAKVGVEQPKQVVRVRDDIAL